MGWQSKKAGLQKAASPAAKKAVEKALAGKGAPLQNKFNKKQAKSKTAGLQKKAASPAAKMVMEKALAGKGASLQNKFNKKQAKSKKAGLQKLKKAMKPGKINAKKLAALQTKGRKLTVTV